MNRTGVLSDYDIFKEQAEYGRARESDLRPNDEIEGLDIRPFDSDNVQPASYDLTLGSEFIFETDMVPENGHFSVDSGIERSHTTERESVTVHPGEFLLGHTAETVEIPSYITAEVKGRSSLGRLGLIPHTAGWIDPGFTGQITLEFVNHGNHPVVIEPGNRVAQIVFSYTSSPASRPYGDKRDTKYQHQSGVTESRIEQDQ